AGAFTIVVPTSTAADAELFAAFGSGGASAEPASVAVTKTSPASGAEPRSVIELVPPAATGVTSQVSVCRSPLAVTAHGLSVSVNAVPASVTVRTPLPLAVGPALPYCTTMSTGALTAAGAGVAPMPLT